MAEHTTELQRCIDQMLAGDDSYRQILVDHAYDRLRLLAGKLIAGYPAVRRWEQTDDVLQNAALRLWRSLEEVTPQDVRSFFALAAVQIRRELIDMARHHYGPHGIGAKHATNDGEPGEFPENSKETGTTDDPVSLTEWTELHEKVQELPDVEREVFDLLYYHGLTQAEAAEILGIPLRTLKRHWLHTRRRLYRTFHGSHPAVE